MTFCSRKTGFAHSRSRTYCVLLLGYFGLKLLPDIRHCAYWVVVEIWAQTRPTRFAINFLFITARAKRKVRFVCEIVWYFSWVNTHPLDLKFVAFSPKFSGDSYMEFQEKTISGEFFGNFEQTKAILYQNLWTFALLSTIFILGLYWAEKVHTSTFTCCLHSGKEAHR